MSLPELVAHDRMVSDRTVSSLRLWAQNCGAVFPQDAELGKIVEKARRALSGASREDLGELQLMFAIGMEPFVVALRTGKHSLRGEQELGEADAKQLDLIIGYLTADTDKGLTGYASQLNRELSTLGDRAAQLVAYVHVPAPNRPKAETLVREYLAMFASVVTPGDSS